MNFVKAQPLFHPSKLSQVVSQEDSVDHYGDEFNLSENQKLACSSLSSDNNTQSMNSSLVSNSSTSSVDSNGTTDHDDDKSVMVHEFSSDPGANVSMPALNQPPALDRTSTTPKSTATSPLQGPKSPFSAAFLQSPRRPGMLRYNSLPTISTLSPTRQHFRIHNNAPREIKETLNANLHRELSSGRTFINQYELLESIGSGSLSTVQLCIDRTSDTKYAIKKFSKAQLQRKKRAEFLHKRKLTIGGSSKNASDMEQEWKQTSSPIDLIRREVAIMKKLDHPNIVNLVEVLDDSYGDNIYMIMEWCSKGVLANTDIRPLLVSAPIYSEEECRLYFRDMLLGIEYLHSQGIVHRDIKAENVLVSDDYVVKIADFGVSEIFDKSEMNDLLLTNHAGSPAYMAPELVNLMTERKSSGSRSSDIAASRSVSGKAADIWSLGCILYYILFGMMPFTASDMSELLEKIARDEPQFPVSTPENIKKLLQGMLEKDPLKRMIMKDIREDSWVTKNGEDPLLSVEENCAVDITPVTDEDMQEAIEHIEGFMNPEEASGYLRRLHGWRGSLSSSRSSRAISPDSDKWPASSAPQRSSLPPPELAGGNGDKSSLLKLTRALDEIIAHQNSSPPTQRGVSQSPLFSPVLTDESSISK